MGDLKIIFFIFNSFSMLVPGILLFSLGVGGGVLTKMEPAGENVGHILGGLAMMFVAMQGYSGAAKSSKKAVDAYTSLTAILSIAAIVNLARTCEAKPGISKAMLAEYTLGYMLMISYTVVMIITTLLGGSVALQIRLEEEVKAQGTPALKHV